mmetsp:Transcript_2681/g.2747  ORF Transcript_2681/g.2747 Transcript_2681/m.2747 type:complete len:229 (-) Transcript_2681:79-765(-)
MSCYDQVFFKSKYEETTNKLPTKTILRDYKQPFIEVYEGSSKEDLKYLANLEPQDYELFDYFFSDNFVSKDFFSNSKLFNDKMSNNEKLNYLLDYLEHKYLLITPSAMKHVCSSLGISTGLDDKEYLDLMNGIFGKESINLRAWKDRAAFKNFLKGKENINEISEDEAKEIQALLEQKKKQRDEKEKKLLSSKENVKKNEIAELFPDISNRSKNLLKEEKEERQLIAN